VVYMLQKYVIIGISTRLFIYLKLLIN